MLFGWAIRHVANYSPVCRPVRPARFETSAAGSAVLQRTAGTWRSLSGEPAPRPDTRPCAAAATRARPTSAGDACGWAPRYSAAAPAACGAAIDVPEYTAQPVSVRWDADVIDTPGANRSTAEPRFEVAARPSPGPSRRP